WRLRRPAPAKEIVLNHKGRARQLRNVPRTGIIRALAFALMLGLMGCGADALATLRATPAPPATPTPAPSPTATATLTPTATPTPTPTPTPLPVTLDVRVSPAQPAQGQTLQVRV